MKFNYFTLLTIILSSLLSVLSNPVVSNNEITEEITLKKRTLCVHFLVSKNMMKMTGVVVVLVVQKKVGYVGLIV